MNKFYEILEYNKELQNQKKSYCTEDFSIFLYSLIKMTRPNFVLELGTGLGTTCFLAAQACKENNNGSIVSFDDGSQWNGNMDYGEYLNQYKNKFELKDFLSIINGEKNSFPIVLKDIQEVNIVFNDIECGPEFFLTLMSWVLPRVNKECYVFIDRGSAYWPSYCSIELLLDRLNNNKIPKSLIDRSDDPAALEAQINKLEFSVTHIRKYNNFHGQDSVAMIKIEQCDIHRFL